MYKRRKPTTPGEILLEEFLKPLGITQKALADHIGCDVKVINRIINERSAVTLAIAIKFSMAFETTPDFWMNAQTALDLWKMTKPKISSLIPHDKAALSTSLNTLNTSAI